MSYARVSCRHTGAVSTAQSMCSCYLLLHWIGWTHLAQQHHLSLTSGTCTSWCRYQGAAKQPPLLLLLAPLVLPLVQQLLLVLVWTQLLQMLMQQQQQQHYPRRLQRRRRQGQQEQQEQQRWLTQWRLMEAASCSSIQQGMVGMLLEPRA